MEKDMTKFQETPSAYAERMWASFRNFEQGEKKKFTGSGIQGNIREGTSFLRKWGAGIAAAVVTFFVLGIIVAAGGTALPDLLAGVIAILAFILPFFVLIKVKNLTEKKIFSEQTLKQWDVESVIQQRKNETEDAIKRYTLEYAAYKAEEKAKTQG